MYSITNSVGKLFKLPDNKDVGRTIKDYHSMGYDTFVTPKEFDNDVAIFVDYLNSGSESLKRLSIKQMRDYGKFLAYLGLDFGNKGNYMADAWKDLASAFVNRHIENQKRCPEEMNFVEFILKEAENWDYMNSDELQGNDLNRAIARKKLRLTLKEHPELYIITEGKGDLLERNVAKYTLIIKDDSEYPEYIDKLKTLNTYLVNELGITLSKDEPEYIEGVISKKNRLAESLKNHKALQELKLPAKN